MSVGTICIRDVVVARPDESVRDAAQRMLEREVGMLVVVDEYGRARGTLTDRDIALRCVAKGTDPGETRIQEVMSSPVSWVLESTPIEEAISLMGGHHARRLVVRAEHEERAVGVLAFDDVLALMAEEATAIGRLLRRP